MKNFLACLFILSFSLASAQNLVHNPSFEQSTTCPSDTGQISFASEWFGAGAGGDFFDSCCGSCQVSTPLNYMGYQQPYMGGHAYVGFYFYKEYAADSHGYICGNLDPLTKDHWYRIVVHVCGTRHTKYRSDGPQVFLYVNQTIPQTQLLYFTPQIDLHSFIAEDTTNWTIQQAIFYADSAYTKIIIGNFKDDAHSLISQKYPQFFTPDARDAAYGYIDEISVVDITASYLAGLETEQQTVTAYPNPFTEQTTLSFDNPQRHIHTLTVYSMQGIRVKQIENITTNEVSLQRDGLPAGYYFYRLSNNEGVNATGKVLIQ